MAGPLTTSKALMLRLVVAIIVLTSSVCQTNAVLLDRFSFDQVSSIRSGAEKIMAETNKDDLVLFLGNSASYFYFALDPSDTHNRKVALIPISGRYYVNELYDEETRKQIVEKFGAGALADPSDRQREAFYAKSLAPGLRDGGVDPGSAAVKDEIKRVVLVDMSYGGTSITAFAMLLRRFPPLAGVEEIKFVNVMSAHLQDQVVKPDPKYVGTTAFVDVDDDDINGTLLDKMLGGEVERLCEDFGPPQWIDKDIAKEQRALLGRQAQRDMVKQLRRELFW